MNTYRRFTARVGFFEGSTPGGPRSEFKCSIERDLEFLDRVPLTAATTIVNVWSTLQAIERVKEPTQLTLKCFGPTTAFVRGARLNAIEVAP